MRRSWFGWPPVLLLALQAAGCGGRPASQPSNPAALTPAAVAGCYLFTDSAGRPLRSASGFWTAPVRLDTALAFVDGDGADTLEAGTFALTPTAPIAPEQAMDTAFLRAAWRLLPPDTLLVTRSQDFGGHTIRLRPRGRNFVGSEVWGEDVAEDNARAPVTPAIARRVECPPAPVSKSHPAA